LNSLNINIQVLALWGRQTRTSPNPTHYGGVVQDGQEDTISMFPCVSTANTEQSFMRKNESKEINYCKVILDILEKVILEPLYLIPLCFSLIDT